jgi:hypothetical protein
MVACKVNKADFICSSSSFGFWLLPSSPQSETSSKCILRSRSNLSLGIERAEEEGEKNINGYQIACGGHHQAFAARNA